MKKIISLILVLINLIIPLNTYANTSKAYELIDESKVNNLTINYSYDNCNFDNILVKLYFVANITSDFKYELTTNFKEYPILVNDIKESNEFNTLKETIDSYIKADDIKEDEKEIIKNNQVLFENLESGLYLIKTESINKEDYTLITDSIIINLPTLNEHTWNYDSIIYPKTYEYIKKYENIKYSVQKQWVDNKNNRPSSVSIEIYKDNVLFKNINLSSENNWTYEWEYLDDGSNFFVVERSVPDDYTVSINKNNNNFVIINKTKEEIKNPQTYLNINLYLYLLMISFISLIILTIYLVKRRK